jgi:hypothetical protein
MFAGHSMLCPYEAKGEDAALKAAALHLHPDVVTASAKSKR